MTESHSQHTIMLTLKTLVLRGIQESLKEVYKARTYVNALRTIA